MACSRRDDLESLGYVLIYLLNGSLPWYNPCDDSDVVDDDNVTANKLATSIEELTNGLPDEFKKFFEDVMELDFSEEPDYYTLRKRFERLAQREGFVLNDGAFDWKLQDKRVDIAKPASS